MQDDVRGTSAILSDGREAVAVAIALQRYANILFTNDATPPYALSMESHFKDGASKKNFLAALRKWSTGRNRHQPAILEYGLKPHRMGLTAEEAQFLETRRELWLDLCRLWRVPPHKVGILDKATFSNIEHQSLEFVIDTLRPVLELIERSVGKFLIDQPGIYFEFNVESLLRGDIKARYEAYAIGRQWGWLSVNDVLRIEHKNGIGPAGDRYIEPLNMVPVGTTKTDRAPDKRASVETSIAFLRESVSANGGRPRLELVKDAA
jgi:HK97 family phage portal protein